MNVITWAKLGGRRYPNITSASAIGIAWSTIGQAGGAPTVTLVGKLWGPTLVTAVTVVT